MKKKKGIPPIKIKDIKVKCELFGGRHLFVRQGNYSTLEVGVEDRETGTNEVIALVTNKNAKKIINILKSYIKQNKRWE
jgi:hypothetical protein